MMSARLRPHSSESSSCHTTNDGGKFRITFFERSHEEAEARKPEMTRRDGGSADLRDIKLLGWRRYSSLREALLSALAETSCFDSIHCGATVRSSSGRFMT